MKSRYDVDLLPEGTGLFIKVLTQSNDLDGARRATALGRTIKQASKIKWMAHAHVYDLETKEILGTGVAICSPKDVPNHKTGRFVARTRAIKDYESNRLKGVAA